MSLYTQCLEAENESLRYQIRDYKKKVKTLKERAWEWLDNRLEYYAEDTGKFDYKAFFGDFRKAMGAETAVNLTWEDVRKIVEIDNEMLQTAHDVLVDEESYYSEVLRRYNENR